MADEHYEFAVTIPAATPKTAPIVTDISIPVRTIEKIQWIIPPGAMGTTGFRLSSGGVQVIPANRGAFIIRDGSLDGAALARLHNSGKWDVTAYNTGLFAHTIYISLYVALIVIKPVTVTPFGIDDLQLGISSPPAHPTVSRQ